MSILSRILPGNETNRKWFAVIFTVVVAAVLTLLGIYANGDYGVALFILTPLFIGLCSAILYGYRRPITRAAALRVSFLSLGIYTFCLFLFAIEGIICILMVAPLGLFLTWVGGLIGHQLVERSPGSTPAVILILIAGIPGVSFIDRDTQPRLLTVTTSIEIDADPQTVWKYVIEFPPLEEPTELLFKVGIAYPVNATINGKGVGAVRYCNFNTGQFIEPITIWDEPRVLAFDVAEHPLPMKELSIWNVRAPHLDNYFVSKKGQFNLTELPGGKTLLVGTTWYHHNFKPGFYWRLWSELIIHKIHTRVLKHIKHVSEK